MLKNNYTNIEDFISDESFVSWAKKINENDMAAWDYWIANHPEKIKIIEDAVTILSLSKIKEKPVSEQRLANAEEKLRASMKAYPVQAKVIPIKRKRIWYSAAAILLIAFSVGLTYLFNFSGKQIKIATQYGQIQTDKLPDGTEVTLNANTKLTLGKEWKEGESREVWIKGEAFFHVKKTPRHDKFIVHTDAFDIEVTGTSFNVINIDGKSSVVLKEGSVKIHRPGEAEILMKPGDFVEYSNQKIEKKTISKDDYMAWTQNKLVFDNTKLIDVANIIKEHYGVDVKLEGDNIEDKTITGIMPNDNLDVLLEALEATQEFTINRTNNSITILNKN